MGYCSMISVWFCGLPSSIPFSYKGRIALLVLAFQLLLLESSFLLFERLLSSSALFPNDELNFFFFHLWIILEAFPQFQQ